MSNPISYVNLLVAKSSEAIRLIGDLQQIIDMHSEDPTLSERYFTTPGARLDIIPQDIRNALVGVGALVTAYHAEDNTRAAPSSPATHKSYLFKMVP